MMNTKIPKLLFGVTLMAFSLPFAAFPINERSTHLSGLKNEFFDASASQQNGMASGVVKDEKGEPLIGVNIKVKGDKTGTTTDIDGKFLIKVSQGKTLVFTYLGYLLQEVKVGNTPLTIVMKESSESLDEVVVTAFGSGQKKASMVGSVQTIKPSELKVPSSNLSTSFAGRLAGVVAVQRSGQPGADAASFWIRGISTFSGATNPLIILDGVEVSSGDLNSLDPEVIEGFSILKDATATALYGTRGANGVMIVTTKSGRDSDRPQINFRVEARVANPTKVPKVVGGAQYMEMYNEASLNRSSGEILYSQDKINGTMQGLNSYVYPNVNWYDELFKNSAWSENFNVNIRGGSKKLDYFMNVKVEHESGMLKNRSKEFFSYDNNINIMRYNFQNNINLNLSQSSKISLKLNTQLLDVTNPLMAADDLFGMVMQANPVDFPVTFPNNGTDKKTLWGGKDGGRYNSGYRNPLAEMTRGYNTGFQSTVIANLDFVQKLDFVTPGLSTKLMASFKNWSNTGTKRQAGYNQFALKSYTLDESNALSKFELQRIGDEQTTTLGTTGSTSGDRRIYLQGMVNYDRTFGLHNVSGMFVYHQDQYDINNPSDLLTSLSRRKQGMAGRATYSYRNTYLAEVNFGYNGSENFAKGKRWGFFPSFALGYTVSEEAFWEPISKILPYLKLRGSWGKVGNDDGGARFLYMSDINLKDREYITGINQDFSLKGPKYLRFQNNNISWEIGNKLNVGVDFSLFNALNITVDGFQEIRSNIFMERQTIPTFFGTSDAKIYGNLGKVKNWGFDGSVDYNKRIGKDLMIGFKSTFTFARNKILSFDEPEFNLYPHLSRVGQPLNRHLLYVADRLFIDNAEVANSAKQMIGGIVMGGDIKYINQPDVYGKYDNKIDGNDKQYMGDPTVPEIVYGFGPTLQWKNFDFSFFFQGVAKTSLLMENFHPFGSSDIRNVLDFVAADYWTESNPNIYASYPRLSKMDMPNNTAGSSYWLRDGSFLKLKNVELGFSYKKMRLYVSGSNVLTFSKFKLWDPEMGGGAGMKYPTQRVINFGFQMTIN